MMIFFRIIDEDKKQKGPTCLSILSPLSVSKPGRACVSSVCNMKEAVLNMHTYYFEELRLIWYFVQSLTSWRVPTSHIWTF